MDLSGGKSKQLLYGATVKRPQLGPPENFQPIRNWSLNKEMNMETSRETVLFFWFNPKFLAMFEDFTRFLYGWNATLFILLLQQEIILDLDLKRSVASQKKKWSPFIGNACVSEKIALVSSRAVIMPTRQAFRFHSSAAHYFKPYKHHPKCNWRVALVFIPKLLARNKRFVSISVEMFLEQTKGNRAGPIAVWWKTHSYALLHDAFIIPKWISLLHSRFVILL